jgi:hypothetical protein
MVVGLACSLGVAGDAGLPPIGRLQAGMQVGVVYRGTPRGEPRLADLTALRAAGFSAIVWPEELVAGRTEARRIATEAGLRTLVAGEPGGAPAAGIAYVTSGSGADVRRAAAMAWRHVQRGARVIAFDPQASAGPGLTDEAGQPLAWVAEARALARQLSVNAALFESLQPGPAVTVRTEARDLQVSLLQTPRSWVLFATSLDSEPRAVAAELPPAVPAALWTSLLDGSDMSMLSRPEGPLWTFEIPAFGVQVYVIEKTGK